MTIVPNHAQTTGRAYVNSAFCREGLSAEEPATGCSLAGIFCGFGVSCSMLSLTTTSVPASCVRPRTLTLLVPGVSTMFGTKGGSVTGFLFCTTGISGSRSVGSSSTSGGVSPEPGNWGDDYKLVFVWVEGLLLADYALIKIVLVFSKLMSRLSIRLHFVILSKKKEFLVFKLPEVSTYVLAIDSSCR